MSVNGQTVKAQGPHVVTSSRVINVAAGETFNLPSNAGNIDTVNGGVGSTLNFGGDASARSIYVPAGQTLNVPSNAGNIDTITGGVGSTLNFGGEATARGGVSINVANNGKMSVNGQTVKAQGPHVVTSSRVINVAAGETFNLPSNAGNIDTINGGVGSTLNFGGDASARSINVPAGQTLNANAVNIDEMNTEDSELKILFAPFGGLLL
mmetsp:Transcript_1935/g.5281  ORF Transcript_1935/g.5281 Transcript_1935/m.5281 type:complete len:209 (+) Transcript_1935:76-702(+)